jgi:hypothetical protein
MADTLYADVSEWQVGVNDTYPYSVLCIRSNDGTYRDRQWVNNYGWCLRNVDTGRLTFFIVYFVWRPNWRETVETFKSQVRAPHPRMAVMIDVESWGGQISGDQSTGINAAYEAVGAYVGSPAKVIGYGNVGDLNLLWPTKPAGVRLVVAAYGSNPPYPGKIAHQYTDGQGYGGGLPDGAPPVRPLRYELRRRTHRAAVRAGLRHSNRAAGHPGCPAAPSARGRQPVRRPAPVDLSHNNFRLRQY